MFKSLVLQAPLTNAPPLVPAGFSSLICNNADSNLAALVCVVPSGNFIPPVVDSMVPATVSFCAGAVVPMPTLPL